MKPPNGALRFMLAFALGIGTAVAATFTTFETQKAHDKDLAGVQDTLKIIQQDIKVILQRVPPAAQARPIPPWTEQGDREKVMGYAAAP